MVAALQRDHPAAQQRHHGGPLRGHREVRGHPPGPHARRHRRRQPERPRRDTGGSHQPRDDHRGPGGQPIRSPCGRNLRGHRPGGDRPARRHPAGGRRHAAAPRPPADDPAERVPAAHPGHARGGGGGTRSSTRSWRDATPQALERARLHGFDPDAEYRVATVVIDEALPLSRRGFPRREEVGSAPGGGWTCSDCRRLVSTSLNQVPILVPGAASVDRVWLDIRGEGLALAVGRAHAGIARVRQSYLEATALIDHLEPGAVAHYDRMLLPRELAGDAARTGRLPRRGARCTAGCPGRGDAEGDRARPRPPRGSAESAPPSR